MGILRKTTTQFVWNYKMLLTKLPISWRSSECGGAMPLCLRVMEIRNIAGMLNCCERESAVTLESVALIVWWIYSCLISTAIIHSWLPRCLSRGQIVCGSHSERMQGESECIMAALSIDVIIWGKAAAAPLSYLHDNNTGTGLGGGGVQTGSFICFLSRSCHILLPIIYFSDFLWPFLPSASSFL